LPRSPTEAGRRGIALVPADRRRQFFNNQLRSQSDALSLLRQLELGRISQ